MMEWTLKNEDINFCKLRISNNHGRILKSLQCSDYFTEMFISIWNKTSLQERAVFISVTGSVLRGKIVSQFSELRTHGVPDLPTVTKVLRESLPECLEQEIDYLLALPGSGTFLQDLGIIVALAKCETYGVLEELSNLVLNLFRFVAKSAVSTADLAALFQSGLVADRVGGGQGLLRGEKYVLSNILYNQFEDEIASLLWDRFGPAAYPSDLGSQDTVLYSILRLLTIHMVVVEDKLLENISMLTNLSNRSHDTNISMLDYRSRIQSFQDAAQPGGGELTLTITKLKSPKPSVVRVSQEHHKYFKLRMVLKSVSPLNLVESYSELSTLGVFYALNSCWQNKLEDSETAVYWNFMAINVAPTPASISYWNEYIRNSLLERNYHMNYDELENRRRVVHNHPDGHHSNHGYYSASSQGSSYHHSYSANGSATGPRHQMNQNRTGYHQQGNRPERHKQHKSGTKDTHPGHHVGPGSPSFPEGDFRGSPFLDGEQLKGQKGSGHFGESGNGLNNFSRSANGYQVRRMPQHRGSAEGFMTGPSGNGSGYNKHYNKLTVDIYASKGDNDFTPTEVPLAEEIGQRKRGFTNFGKQATLKGGADKHRVRFESSNDQELMYLRASKYESALTNPERELPVVQVHKYPRRLSSKEDVFSDHHLAASAGKKKTLKATSSSYFGPDEGFKQRHGTSSQAGNEKGAIDNGETNVSLNLEELDFSNVDKRSSGWTQNRKNDSNLFTIEDKESLAHKNSGLDYSENASLLYLMQIPLRPDEQPGSKQSLNSSVMSKDLSGCLLNSPRTDTSRNGKLNNLHELGPHSGLPIDQNKSMPDETCSRKETRRESDEKARAQVEVSKEDDQEDFRILRNQSNQDDNSQEGERRDTGIPLFMANRFDLVGAVTTGTDSLKTTLYNVQSNAVLTSDLSNQAEVLEDKIFSIPDKTQAGNSTTESRKQNSSKKGVSHPAQKEKKFGYVPKEDPRDYLPRRNEKKETQRSGAEMPDAARLDDPDDNQAHSPHLKSHQQKKPFSTPAGAKSQQNRPKRGKAEAAREKSPESFDKDAFPSLQEVDPKFDGPNLIEEAMQKQVALKAAQQAAANALAKEAAEAKEAKEGRKKKPRTPNYEKNPRRNAKY